MTIENDGRKNEKKTKIYFINDLNQNCHTFNLNENIILLRENYDKLRAMELQLKLLMNSL